MNTIRNDLPPEIKKFFINLQNYIDTPLYFYGSVTRADYIPGKSDVDVAIFTDNEYSMLSKLQHYLHIKRNSFDKIIHKMHGKIIYGYKIKCKKYTGIDCEISIYNDEFKDIIIKDKTTNNEMPFYIYILLTILKTFHYTIPLIPEKTYSEYKMLLFNIMKNRKDYIFFVLKET
jgi:hypothetical protein